MKERHGLGVLLSQLICRMQALCYKTNTKGVCFGLAYMGMQSFLIGKGLCCLTICAVLFQKI